MIHHYWKKEIYENTFISSEMVEKFYKTCNVQVAKIWLDSVVNTLTLCNEFEIDKVQILIEGERKQALGPLYIWEPYSANTNSIKE